jgi:hypothetical protein
MSRKRAVAILGGGPAGLMAAEVVAGAGHAVTIYDRMPSLGRKLLMAGRGGLNLTHSEPLEIFLSRYHPPVGAIAAAVRAFPPGAAIDWCNALGQPTFKGTSGRVFPKALKASPLLRAWLRRLGDLGVAVQLRASWVGFSDSGGLIVEREGVPEEIAVDAAVLALGGASWPRLGADGSWARALSASGVSVTPLTASNAGVRIAWSRHMTDRFAGRPLKRIAVAISAGPCRRGEAVITRTGLEGGAIYALSPDIRAALHAGKPPRLRIDLRPDMPSEEIARRLARPRGRHSLANHLRKALALEPQSIALLNEVRLRSDTPWSETPEELAALIKRISLQVDGMSDLDRAISTAGGVSLDEIDDRMMLKRRPGLFVAGEMLDWDAPTGGYLLQACLATGHAAGSGVLAYLASDAP